MKTSMTSLRWVDGLQYSTQRYSIQLSDTCVLCTLMGASAEHVQIVWQFEKMQQA